MTAATGTVQPTTSVRVDYEEMDRLAGVWMQTAEDVGRVAWAVTMIAGEMNLAGALDPVGAMRTEAALIDVLTGPGGLGNLALRLGVDAAHLATVVAKERIVDNFPASELASFWVWTVIAPYRLVFDPKGTVRDGKDRLARLGEASAIYLLPVLDDLASLADASASVVLPVGREQVLDWVSGEVGDRVGAGIGVATPSTMGAGMSTEPIGSLAQALVTIDDLYGAPSGTIAIQTVSSADGATRYVVELPGIQDLFSSHPQNLPQAAGALLSPDSSYSRAVVKAMHAAGVPAGAEVMLVGHSEGGIVAMNLSADTAFNGDYVTVTHVVAAAAPISSKEVAAGSGTRVLTVENTYDAVVHADLADSINRPMTADWLPYKFSDNSRHFFANHDATMYAQHLAEIENGPHPGMLDFAASTHKYLDGPVSTQTFVLSSGPSS